MTGGRTISGVRRQPLDDFGQYLAKLRKAKGYSARALSMELGLGEAYFITAETTDIQPSPDILIRAADVLGIDTLERQALLRLASQRSAGGDRQAISSEPDENLFLALMQRPHSWADEPAQPSVHLDKVRSLIDAMGWAIIEYGGESPVHPMISKAQWPGALSRMPRPRNYKGNDAIIVPESIVRDEVPRSLLENCPRTQEQVDRLFTGLARAFRRTFFSDIQRARDACADVTFWAVDHSGEAPESLYVVFRGFVSEEQEGEPEYVGLTIEDVSMSTVASAGEWNLARDVAARAALWHTRQRRVEAGWAWPPIATFHVAAIHAVAAAETRAFRTYGDGQPLRDADYVFSKTSPDFGAISIAKTASKDLVKRCEDAVADGRIGDELRRKLGENPLLLMELENTNVTALYLSHQLERVPLSPREIARMEKGTKKRRQGRD